MRPARYQAQGAAAFWSMGGGQGLRDSLQGRGLGLGQVEHGPSGKVDARGQAEHVPAKDAAQHAQRDEVGTRGRGVVPVRAI